MYALVYKNLIPLFVMLRLDVCDSQVVSAAELDLLFLSYGLNSALLVLCDEDAIPWRINLIIMSVKSSVKAQSILETIKNENI